MATRRQDFLDAGGFHEGYFYGFEDVDLCLTNVIQRGKRVVSANQLTAFHDRGYSRLKMDRESALRMANNGNLLDERLAYAYRRQTRADLFDKPGFWNVSSPRIAFAVTEAGPEATAGDYFTALELAREFEAQFDCECCFIERGEHWYDLSGIDVLITMIDAYDTSQIENASPHLIKVAWVRNWFERFAENPSASAYDLIWASSTASADYLETALRKPVSTFRLATNWESFQSGTSREEFASDYCFTGSYWKQPREIASYLDHQSVPFEGKIFGKGWEGVASLRDIAQGPRPYRDIPDVYASTRIVVDDANHVTKPWGSVNSRVFDGLAANRLVVTNSVIGNEEVFGGKMPTYSSAEELSQLLHRYLGDETARNELTAELRSVVEHSHTYRHRAADAWARLSEASRSQLRFAIKIGAPTSAVKDEWGDYHFACGIKRELDRHGHTTRIDCLDSWDRSEAAGDDVVIVLRGLSQYKPRADQINVVWLLSHPDRVELDELEEFDHVFVASRTHAEMLDSKLATPVTTLLQCTDPQLFSPPDAATTSDPPTHSSETDGAVLVGNSRNVFRSIVRDCIEAGVDVKVVGTRWEQFLEEGQILAEHIPNTELPAFYARCDLVLNDHWDTMREHGFLSNRLFDAAACGAQILTDRIAGLEDIFGDVVLTYDGVDELAEIVRSAPSTHASNRSQRNELAAHIAREHSFEKRVEEILAIVQPLDQHRLGTRHRGNED